MKEKNNGYYKAVGIISYISASLLVLVSVLFIILVAVESSIIAEWFDSFYLEEVYYSSPESQYAYEYNLFTTVIVVYGIIMLAMSAYTFIQASYFIKYSKLSNEQASLYFNKCLAWSICALIFTGWINGLLAFLGLFLVQKKQKLEFEQAPIIAKEREKQEEISVEKLERAQSKLAKLAELKNVGALTEEEFKILRDKVMRELNNKPVDEVDQTSQRLSKLQELKNSGTINDEEYESLRKKIVEQMK